MQFGKRLSVGVIIIDLLDHLLDLLKLDFRLFKERSIPLFPLVEMLSINSKKTKILPQNWIVQSDQNDSTNVHTFVMAEEDYCKG